MLISSKYMLTFSILALTSNGQLLIGFLSDIHVDPNIVRQSIREVWDKKLSYLLSNATVIEKQYQAIDNLRVVDLNSETDLLHKTCESLKLRPDMLIVISRCACTNHLVFLSTALKLPVFEISLYPRISCQIDKCADMKYETNNLPSVKPTEENLIYITLGKQFLCSSWSKMVILYDSTMDISQISLFIDQLKDRMHNVIIQKLQIRANGIQQDINLSSSLVNSAMEGVWDTVDGSRGNGKSRQIVFLLFMNEANVRRFVLKVMPDLPFSFYVQYYVVDMGWMDKYFLQSLLFRDGVTVITKSKKQDLAPMYEDYESKSHITEKLSSRFGLLSRVIQNMKEGEINFFSSTQTSCSNNAGEIRKNTAGLAFSKLLMKRMGIIKKGKSPSYYVNDIYEEYSNISNNLQICNIEASGKIVCQELSQTVECNDERSFKNLKITTHAKVINTIDRPTTPLSARSHYGNRFKNKTFRVVTVQDEPFVFVRNDSSGHQTFSGFSIDLLDMLSELIGFQYEVYQVEDKKYGTFRNGKWNGLVGDVVAKKADIAIAAMTITPQREMVLDFTKRYMDYAVGILMKKPKSVNNLFAFLNPFDNTVWYSIIAGLFLVSILLYVLNLVSPKRIPGPPYHDTSLHGTFWFVYSSLVQQGTDMNLVTLSSQIVTGVWWFFILIIISSYTANLAAHLTVTRLENHITSFRDLSKQNELRFGTGIDTSIFDFLKTKGQNSRDAESMWTNLWKVVNGSNSVIDPKQGFSKVKTENYAFMWDVAVIEYLILTDPDCIYSTVDDSIYNKGYGIGVAQGNEIRDAMSMGILELQDSGEISTLKHRWWTSVGMCQTDHNGKRSHSSELTLENFAGVFCVLACGLVIASLVAVFEICRFMRQGKRNTNREVHNTRMLKKGDNGPRRPKAFVKEMIGDEIHIVLSDSYN